MDRNVQENIYLSFVLELSRGLYTSILT